MAQDSVGKSGTKRGTNQFMRQGQTASCYGNDPNVRAKGAPTSTRELKP